MCPLAGAINSGRYLLMSCDVSPGKVAKNPRLMTWVHVRGLGLQQDKWRYCARSFLVHILYTLDATGMVDGSGLGSHVGSMWVSQRPDGWFL